MKIELDRTPDAQRSRFTAVVTPFDVADLLEVDYSTLVYHLYRIPAQIRYKTFVVRKRAGGARVIRSPQTHLKILQQKLATILANTYSPRRCVHGFVEGRSSVSNASPHVGAAWVLNVDLQDFFPSINFGRVRGLFMS